MVLDVPLFFHSSRCFDCFPADSFSSLTFCFHTNLHGDCKHKLPSCCSPVLLAFSFMLTVSNSFMFKFEYFTFWQHTYEVPATCEQS